MAASSSPSTHTFSPFLPITIAVPVSWHMGNILPAEILAFFNKSNATKRSFSEASGSSSILLSCWRCDVRKRWEVSENPSAVKWAMPSGSILRTSRSPVKIVSTKSSVIRRYSVVSSKLGIRGWKLLSLIIVASINLLFLANFILMSII